MEKYKGEAASLERVCKNKPTDELRTGSTGGAVSFTLYSLSETLITSLRLDLGMTLT